MPRMPAEKIQTLQAELDLLYHVAQVVHSYDLDDVLQEIVQVAEDLTQADSVFIYVADMPANELVLRASKNPHSGLLRQITLKMGEGITGWVASEKEPVAISNGASKDSRFRLFRRLPEDRYEAFLSVLIISKRGVVGVINVQHEHGHQHSESEIKMLATVGKLVGGAVENALLSEETLALKEALELRKLVEKAKGVLMKKRRVTEDEAYKLIQKESMNNRKTLKEVAEAILLLETLDLDS